MISLTDAIYNDRQEALADGISTIADKLKRPVCFGHVCKGNLSHPGVYRVSAVVGNATVEGFDKPLTGEDHRRAFGMHVRFFGRDRTLLNWVVHWSRKKAVGVEVTPSTPVVLPTAFVINEEHHLRVSRDNLTTTILLSRGLLDTLAPAQLATDYLNALYTQALAGRSLDLDPQEFATQRIRQEAAQLQALDFLHDVGQGEMGTTLQELVAVYPDQAQDGPASDDGARRLLAAIQLVLFYVRFFAPNALDDGGGFVSVAAFFGVNDESFNEGHAMKCPIAVVSTHLADTDELLGIVDETASALDTKPLAIEMENLSHENAQYKVPDAATLFSERGYLPGADAYTDVVAKSIQAAVNDQLGQPPFPRWSAHAPQWLAALLALLRGKKHEGIPLGFTFVLGDLAEIEDSPHFETLRLVGEQFAYPPAEGENVNAALNAATKQVSKANYFWFQGGRYALLWDIAYPMNHPCYLLALKDSSWEVFVANARNRRMPAAARAATFVGYVLPDGAGGIVVCGQHAFSLSRDGAWLQRGADLGRRIKNYLLHVSENLLDDDAVETLTRAIVAVSTDPDLGCMLAIMEPGDTPQFRVMGQPWQVLRDGATGAANGPAGEDGIPLDELPEQELIAMLGMDGAACVWKKDADAPVRISFRHLASPPAPKEPQRVPHKKAVDKNQGEGTRKWSALLAACRKDVRLIMAVSQDGPVHVFTQAGVAKAADRLNIDADTPVESVVHDVLK